MDSDQMIKFVFVISMNSCSVSIRRANGSDLESMDLSKIATEFGGGGHPFACGFKFDINDYSTIINKIMTKKFYLE
jgi:nanoRNase/pAp phosphatase (c-di-AMP/oligoRNAs hydrolase)